jgi:hypothetical protein
VLPLHTASLVELACPASSESQCSFGAHPHCVDAICALQSLESLTMSVNAADVPHVVVRPRAHPPNKYLPAAAGHRLPSPTQPRASTRSRASLSPASFPAAPSAARTKISI